MDFWKAVKNYGEQVKACPECGKEWRMKDWPVMPSSGKPKRTCCLTAGWNNKKKYEARKKVVGKVELWRCLRCDEHKPASEFRREPQGTVRSSCRQCHSKKYSGYKSPSEKKIESEKKKRRARKENELIECGRCQRAIKRKYWPKTKDGKRKAKICCSEKTTKQLNRILLKKGRRFCGSCNRILDVSAFSARSDGKLFNPCIECRKLNQTRQASNEKRDIAIKSTDDGTLTKEAVKQLFISQKECLVCNTPMRFEDKTMDHVVPLSKGGAHSVRNVMIMCYSCNSRKSAKNPSEWFESLPYEAKARIKSENHIDMGLFE